MTPESPDASTGPCDPRLDAGGKGRIGADGRGSEVITFQAGNGPLCVLENMEMRMKFFLNWAIPGLGVISGHGSGTDSNLL
jgi:hypothetical protein